MDDINFIEKLIAIVLAIVSVLLVIKKLFTTSSFIDRLHKKVEIYKNGEFSEDLKNKLKTDIEDDVEHILDYETQNEQEQFIFNFVTYLICFIAFCFVAYKAYTTHGFGYVLITFLAVCLFIGLIKEKLFDNDQQS